VCLMDGVGGLFVQLYHKKDDRNIGGITLCIFGCDDLQFMGTQGISFLTGDVGTIEGDVREQLILWRIFEICGGVLWSDNHVFYCNMPGTGNKKSKEMGTEKMNDRRILFKNVSKTIDGQMILKDINLEIPKQGIYGIVGRNGSGKTVLIKCLCGFMPVTKGGIWVGEKQIGSDVEFIEDTGFIIETPGFLPRESGFRNLRYLASIRNVVGKERIRECITMVGLNPDDKKWVGKYSLGMRQRLGIAQTIMENPSLIILDEPMNGLDNHSVEEIRKLLLGLKEEGKLILIISHNREDINLLCDRVYEMDMGVLTRVRQK
jgi:ABC-2 type transport system ATP-binding protein